MAGLTLLGLYARHFKALLEGSTDPLPLGICTVLVSCAWCTVAMVTRGNATPQVPASNRHLLRVFFLKKKKPNHSQSKENPKKCVRICIPSEELKPNLFLANYCAFFAFTDCHSGILQHPCKYSANSFFFFFFSHIFHSSVVVRCFYCIPYPIAQIRSFFKDLFLYTASALLYPSQHNILSFKKTKTYLIKKLYFSRKHN